MLLIEINVLVVIFVGPIWIYGYTNQYIVAQWYMYVSINWNFIEFGNGAKPLSEPILAD